MRHSHSCLAIIPCALPIAMVTPFQLRPDKKDTVVCPLLRHSKYNRKKQIQSSGHHLLRRSNCHCYAVPITTGKKRYSHLSVVTPFQLRPDKIKIQSSGRHSLRCSNCHCCAIPITTRKKRYSRLTVVTPFQLQLKKKRYSRLAIIHCAVPIAIVAPFQLRPE